MKKRLYCIVIVFLLLLSSVPSFANATDTPVNFLVNGKQVSFAYTPIIRDGITYVDLKSIASALSLKHSTYQGHNSVVISNYNKAICFVPDSEHATVSQLSGDSNEEYLYRILAAPCIYINGHVSVAVRDIADVFGYSLSFDATSQTVYFGYAPGSISPASLSSASSKAYYFQNQAEFNFPSHGGGYCWVCSYAMVMTNLTGARITPADVAAVNLRHTSDGAYCYHNSIVSAYGLRFVPALPTTSPYYGGMSGVASGTYINNPTKDRAVTIAALKEALDHHPEGVMVRYANFPHTMVAVGYEGDTILFNDPAPTSSSSYATEGRYHCVPFERTCIPSRGFALEDVSFIQAIGY